MSNNNKPAFILVRPQMGENIGAAARAMANFGLSELVLVAPRDGWPNKAAEANAVGAFEHLDKVRICETVEEAVAPYQTVFATTARPRDMNKTVYTPETAVHHSCKRTNTKTAFLFGGERAGLSNEDISFATHILTVPTNPAFSSLNLGQSVLLMAHEYHRQMNDSEKTSEASSLDDPAPQDELNTYLSRLEQELEKGHFFRNPDMKPVMWNNIRAVFTRAQPSAQEVATLQGILSALIGNKSRKSK